LVLVDTEFATMIHNNGVLVDTEFAPIFTNLMNKNAEDEPASEKRKREASEASESIPALGMQFTIHSHPFILVHLFQVGY
jgi:hypothetical protein